MVLITADFYTVAYRRIPLYSQRKMESTATIAVISAPLRLGVMARKADETREPTEQKNFRLTIATIERVERYIRTHPLRPTFTQVLEASLKEWLDRHEGEATDRPKAKGK